MTKTIGKIVLAARTKRDLTRDQLAKKLDCAPSYVSFIERDRPVWISERLVSALMKSIHASIPAKMIALHNARAKRYAAKLKS